MRQIRTITILAGAALLLGGCELRRDAEPEAEPRPSASAATSARAATPTPSASATPDAAPVISVIRDEDEAPVEPAEGGDAAAVEVVLPFPDGASISPSVERRLVALLRDPAMDEDWPVILGGHTDSGGNDAANLRASRARAEAVAAWLVERGVDNDRIEVVAFGEQNPLAPNARPDGTPDDNARARNRRVEVRIAPRRRAAASAPSSGTAGNR